MNKKFIILLHVTLLLLMTLSFVSCMESSPVDIELHKKLAGELRDNKLFKAAIDEYKKILDDNSLEYKTRANINYLIGKLYFEDLKDYENAAAYYVKAHSLDPEASFSSTANKNLVASLEKMGRMVDAKRKLDNLTDLNSKPKQVGDVEVARVGNKPIWLSEIEQEIQKLSPDIQKQLIHKEAKLNFIHNYVGMELMYRAAVRENYIDDEDVKIKLRDIEKQILVDKYVTEKVIPNVRIDSMDVLNFYSARKSTVYKDAPYDSVKTQVFMDYQREKMETAYSKYLQSLAAVEKVEFFDHNVK